MTNSQHNAKQAVEAWLEAQNVSLGEFAKAMDYTYAHAWALVRGQANLSDEFVGRLLAAYGAEAAEPISAALKAHEEA